MRHPVRPLPCLALLCVLTGAAMAQTPTQPAPAEMPAQPQLQAPTEAPAAPQLPAAIDAPAAPATGVTATTPEAGAPAAGTGAAPETAAPTTTSPAATVPTAAASVELPVPHDLSPMGMYRQAHWVVKAVMLSLLFACFVTWTVWLYKTVEIFVARRRLGKAARLLRGAASLAAAQGALGRITDPAAFMAQEVQAEYTRSDAAIAAAGAEGVKERAVSLVGRIEGQALQRLRRGTGLLATIGATAPFVGLFGTVWGIMNAFIGIAETRTTNLAVVAPGIAEALFATALGLVAAIPAVVIYNHFTRQIGSYRQALGDAAASVLRLLSRDIDFRKHQEG